jgi:hypothetical protein
MKGEILEPMALCAATAKIPIDHLPTHILHACVDVTGKVMKT